MSPESKDRFCIGLLILLAIMYIVFYSIMLRQVIRLQKDQMIPKWMGILLIIQCVSVFVWILYTLLQFYYVLRTSSNELHRKMTTMAFLVEGTIQGSTSMRIMAISIGTMLGLGELFSLFVPFGWIKAFDSKIWKSSSAYRFCMILSIISFPLLLWFFYILMHYVLYIRPRFIRQRAQVQMIEWQRGANPIDNEADHDLKYWTLTPFLDDPAKIATIQQLPKLRAIRNLVIHDMNITRAFSREKAGASLLKKIQQRIRQIQLSTHVDDNQQHNDNVDDDQRQPFLRRRVHRPIDLV